MSRLEKLKDDTKEKMKRKVWRTGKTLGKSYIKYRAVTGAMKYGKKKLLEGRKKEEKE
jgi:hypothetical protein